MMSVIQDYLWPAKCPRCRRKMSLLDKVHRFTLTLAYVVSLGLGKPIKSGARPIQQCDFCRR